MQRSQNVLRVLAGCPNGATVACLTTMHDATVELIYDLIRRGLIRHEIHRIRPPHNWEIVWVFITDAGKATLQDER